MNQPLQVAIGYLELGMFEDAAHELERVRPEDQAQPEVVDLWASIHSGMKNWEQAEVATRQMIAFCPEDPERWVHWAYSARRCQSIHAAKQILLDGEKLHPHDATIQFNLGCYACQLGELEEAMRRVKTAISLDGRYLRMGLEDPDLKPVWNELAGMMTQNPAA